MALVALSLGSNIEAERNLLLAVAMLRGAGRVIAVSRVYETEAVGTFDQPQFLNAAIMIETGLDADAFKNRVIAGIERALGRVRDPRDKNAPRTIDVDVAFWQAGEGEAGGPPPDPGLTRWAHVAVPVAEVAPDFVPVPGGLSLAEIAARLAARGPAPLPRPDIALRAAAGLVA